MWCIKICAERKGKKKKRKEKKKELFRRVHLQGEDDSKGQDQVELPGEEGSATVLGLGGIGRMALKKLTLVIQGLLDGLGRVDVLLSAVHNGDIT